MSSLHGFKRGEQVLYITHLPDLKKPVLLVGNGNVCQKIASFDCEGYAEDFCRMLDEWLNVRWEGKDD